MPREKKSVLLLSMPFAGVGIPSIQLPVLAGYLQERGITTHTRNLYLNAAAIYGLSSYNTLISPPNDSYTAQLGFSKYVFPNHWEQTQSAFQHYFEEQLMHNREYTFDAYMTQTDTVYNSILNQIDWGRYGLIGFTLNYGQLLPSLAIAKAVKERFPETQIILGGSRVMEHLGVNILKAFPYIDFAVSGDGEAALARLANGEPYQSVPRLIYRENKDVLWNQSNETVDLDASPLPCYDQFYEELAASPDEIKRYFQYYGRLPVEISRGCWWNQCTFCNLNVYNPRYREKSVGRIIKEIQILSDRYRILDFQLIGNTLPRKNHRALFEQLRSLGRDFSFVAEARADHLTSNDYTLMKAAGFSTIQTGIESFSPNYLKKMNKGARVIDNIAALKFCKENIIQNQYNLVVNYPNEEPLDFQETQQVVQQIQTYLDPPQLCDLRVMYGSKIQRLPEQFNIKSLTNAPIDRIMYPPEYLEKGFTFVYDFVQEKPSPRQPWESIIAGWKKIQENNEGKRTVKHDRQIFYFVDGGTFLKVYDERDPQNIRIFVLDEQERLVFLACTDIVSFQKLQERFSTMPEEKLVEILQSFEQNGLVFSEDTYFLSLPLCGNIKPRTDHAVQYSIEMVH